MATHPTNGKGRNGNRTRKAASEQEAEQPQPAPGDRTWPRPWMGPFLKALSTIPDVSAAARVAGVNRQHVYSTKERNEQFAEAWREALDIARDGVERIAFQWATTGVPVRSVRTVTKEVRGEGGVVLRTTTETVETNSAERSATLMIFWLKANHPEKYRWVEKVGVGADPDADPVKVRALSDIDREIEELSAELARRANGAPVPEE